MLKEKMTKEQLITKNFEDYAELLAPPGEMQVQPVVDEEAIVELVKTGKKIREVDTERSLRRKRRAMLNKALDVMPLSESFAAFKSEDGKFLYSVDLGKLDENIITEMKIHSTTTRLTDTQEEDSEFFNTVDVVLSQTDVV